MNINSISLGIIFLLSIATPAISSEFYVYPPLYAGSSEQCEQIEKAAKDLTAVGGYIEMIADLDRDGICDLLIAPPRENVGNGGVWFHIYDVNRTGYKDIGQTNMGSPKIWLGEERNGFARLFATSYIGHRTNPTFTVDVYYFNGEKYVLEHSSKSSYGHFTDNGLKAYQRKDYSESEMWYLNAYRMQGEKFLKDANNLALVLIKSNQCGEAITLLEKHLKNPLIEDKKYTKSAKYNLSLCTN